MNKDNIMKNTSSYHENFIQELKDPQTANLYLKMAMEEYHSDNDRDAFLLALRNITEAQGGISKLAEVTHINRQHLYNILSPTGNPTLEKLELILKGLGYRLAILPETDNRKHV